MELLAEKLFLLSIDKRTKRPYGRTASLLSYTLNAALLAELLMRECIVIRDKKVEVVDGAKEDGLLDETIQIIQSKRKQSPKQMIATLRREHKNIQVKLAKKLSEAGELDLQSKDLLGKPLAFFYKVKRNNLTDIYSQKFNDLLQRYEKKQSLDEEQTTIILLSLVYHSHLLGILFPDKKEAKEMEQFVKQLNDDLPVSKSLKELIESINISIISAASHFTL